MGHCHRVMGDAWSWALASPLRFKQLEACIAAGQEPSFHRCEPVEDNLMESCLPLVLRSHLYSLSIESNLYLVFRFLFFGGGGGSFFFEMFYLLPRGVGGWVGCKGLRRGCAGAARGCAGAARGLPGSPRSNVHVKSRTRFSLRNIPY